MKLIDLPVDIFSILFSHLVQRNIKNVRLVCRALCNVAELRFPRVFLSANRTNIDAFRGIAMIEKFRTQVREIIWDDARLEFYEREELPAHEAAQLEDDLHLGFRGESFTGEKNDFQTFIRAIENLKSFENKEETLQREAELRGPGVKEISIEESFELYNQFYDEQEAIIKAGEDIEMLRIALKSFPFLKRITVSCEAWRLLRLFLRYETLFFRSLPPGYAMPQPWPWLGRHEDSTEDFLENLRLPWDENNEEWRGYHIVIDELLASAAHHKIEEFVIDTNYELTGISYQLFASSRCSGYKRTVELFRTVQLTTLELSLNIQTAEETEYSCFHDGLLRDALSNLKCIKHFALATSWDTADDDQIWEISGHWVALDEIIPIEIWSAGLESLKLCNLFLLSESLYHAFDHLRSLKAIWLGCIELDDSLTWHDFAVRVKRELVENRMTWKRDEPKMTWRRKAGDIDTHLDSSAELADFLHGDGGCPFTKDNPQTSNLGWVIHNWGLEREYYMTL